MCHSSLNIAQTLARSRANGPGERFVVWLQGCRLQCHGCCNPDMWCFEPRIVTDTASLLDVMLATEGIEGVTFSGGEPFEQATALSELARRVRDAGLSVMVFTGYDLEELKCPERVQLMVQSDVVVAGRYIHDMRTFALPWRGSANQKVHFLTTRYSETDMLDAATAEVHLDAMGLQVLTGFPEDDLIKVVRELRL